MYKFGQEITPVLSGTIWPVQVAQYDRYIHSFLLIKKHPLKSIRIKSGTASFEVINDIL